MLDDLEIQQGVLQFANGDPEIAQQIQSRFRMFVGEWFLDRRLGVQYMRDVFGKNRSKAQVDFLMRRVIFSVPGVASIVSFSSAIGADRRYRLTFEAKTRTGSRVSAVNFDPFLLEGVR